MCLLQASPWAFLDRVSLGMVSQYDSAGLLSKRNQVYFFTILFR
jgi:hypothetical protein